MRIQIQQPRAVRLRAWLCLAGLGAIVAALGSPTARRGRPRIQSSQPGVAALRLHISHFHHLHLNGTDPQSAIKFYTGKFDCVQAKLGGALDAMWAQKSWIIIDKVASPPPWQLTSAIWHFGWGAEDMQATYQKQLDSGTRFFTPITQLAPQFYYAYVEGPDHALVELNTAAHHHFGHLHLFSEDPVSTGEWYIKYFNAKNRSNRPPSRETRFYGGGQVGPAMSLMSDQVNIIVYPWQLAKQSYPDQWKDRTALVSSQG